MTAHAALLRAVLESPRDDLPRLVYADAIERDEPERAEFIRIQVELARIGPMPDDNCRCDGGGTLCGACQDERDWKKDTDALRRRERELWTSNVTTWCPATDDMCYALSESEACSSHAHGFPSRGFIASVRLPLAVFLGERCGECSATGYYFIERNRVICSDCHGIGHVGGCAEQLFRSQPITHVEITDAVIHASGGNDTYYVGNLGAFPAEYWRGLENHRSRSDTRNALAATCLAYGRRLAGLSPLAPTAAPSD